MKSVGGFAVGELWDGNPENLKSWVDASGISAFDFACFYNLEKALDRNKDMRELLTSQHPQLRTLRPEKAVTFTANHDTEKDQNADNIIAADKKLMAYAYILTHSGYPCIFYSDYENKAFKTKLQKLMLIHRSLSIGEEKILLAGATGYLGQYILAALLREESPTRIVVRNKSKLSPALLTHPLLEVVEAEVTQPDTLQGVCKGVHKVISTVGITQQKDGLTYEQVDYGANKNLLDEAMREGVQKFVYVSVFKGEMMRHIAIGAAKERFVDALKVSGLDYCINTCALLT